MFKLIQLLFVLLFLINVTTPSSSQSSYLTEMEKEKLLSLIKENIEKRYVYKDKSALINNELTKLSQTEKYKQSNKPAIVSSLLTEVLQSYDGHFNVTWVDPTAIKKDKIERESWNQRSQRSNYGFRKVESLFGNIGYIDLRFFDGSENAKLMADNIIKTLANSQAVIIDLSQNGGGSPQMVQHLSSYFFSKEKPVHLNSLYWRESEQTVEFWTKTDLDSQYMPEIPLYVITSARTGSAAEEFAYNMQTQKRATLIGNTTAGGANPGGTIPLINNFEMFISTGAAVNPITKTNWEKVGVVPEIKVKQENALNTAYKMALNTVMENTQNKWQKKEIRWHLETLDSINKPFKIEHNELKKYAGRYENREIIFQNKEIFYQRGRRSMKQLIPLSKDLFALASDSMQSNRIRFNRDKSSENIVSFDLLSSNGQENSYTKSDT